MRGPYERLKYDFRRAFECPVCGHRERVEGPATFRVCGCQLKLDPRQQRPMRLVEEGGKRITEPPPRAAPIELPPADAAPPPAPASIPPPDTPPEVAV